MCRRGHTTTSEQLQGISHAGLYCTSRLSRHENCWAIPVPGRERAAGIHITVSSQTCLHVLSRLTGSTGELLQFPLRALCRLRSGSIIPSPSTTGRDAALLPFPVQAATFQPMRSVGEAQGMCVVEVKLVHYISSLAAAQAGLPEEAALSASRALASSLENGAQAGTALLRSCQVERQEGRKETGTRQQNTETSREMGLSSHSRE